MDKLLFENNILKEKIINLYSNDNKEHLYDFFKTEILYSLIPDNAEMIIKIAKKNLILNENFILTVHKLIIPAYYTKYSGKYRNSEISIFNSIIPAPKSSKYIPEQINELCSWFDSYKADEQIKAITFHNKFVSVHPFVECNGRTARTIMNIILIKYGYTPIIMTQDEKKQYKQLVDEYLVKDKKSEYYIFMLKLLNRSMKIFINKLQYIKK